MDLKITSARYAKSKIPYDLTSPRSSIDIDEATTSEHETKDLLGSSERDGKAKRRDTPEPSIRSQIFRRMLQIFTSLLCIGVIFSSYDFYSELRTEPSLKNGNSAQLCGNDPITARSRGCMFDPISVAWLPEKCHDFGLTNEFLQMQQWQFWTDAEGRNPISLANVKEGHHLALFVRETYLQHRCVFAWRKSHRAIINGTAVDGYTVDWNGLEDCEGLFKSSKKSSGVLSKVVVGFPSCSLDY